MTFESLVTSTIITVMAGAALYTIEPAVTAATNRLLVVNQLTDQAHRDAAKALCINIQDATDCASAAGQAHYLDAAKKQAALEETALLGQPLPELRSE